MLLRKRAEEIVDLVRKTEDEITVSDETITGDIHIGTGETDAMRLIIKAAQHLKEEYPEIHYHISSDDAQDVVERLDKGLIDFGVLIGQVDISKYDYIPFQIQDTWGVLMQQDSPLAKKDYIVPEDLWDKPIIISRQVVDNSDLGKWLQRKMSSLNIVATYNLIYNGSLMVDEGLGYALCLDKLINMTGNSHLCFRPLKPELKVNLNIVWKKYQVFPKAAEKFLEQIQREF